MSSDLVGTHALISIRHHVAAQYLNSNAIYKLIEKKLTLNFPLKRIPFALLSDYEAYKFLYPANRSSIASNM
jgi:hypothetical protein